MNFGLRSTVRKFFRVSLNVGVETLSARFGSRKNSSTPTNINPTTSDAT